MNRTLRSLVDHISTGNWLERAILNYDRSYDENDKWVHKNLDIHPSGSSSKCARYIQLGMLGHRFKQSVSRRRMDNGTLIHSLWNDHFERMGILHDKDIAIKLDGETLEVNGTTYSKVHWSGKADVIVKNKDLFYLGELKSMNSDRWENIPDQVADYKAMVKLLEKEEDKYVNQLCQYYTVFSRFYSPLIEKDCFFLFENTDSQEIKVRWVQFTEEKQQNVLDIPLEAQYNLLNGVLLDRPFEPDSSMCKACQRRQVCFDIADGKREINV